MTKGFLRFLRRNTIALVALFLALGGTTYAGSTALIGKNTVASPQVVNGSLQTKDLSAKARKALKGNRGLRGLRGAQGAKGATGAQGVQGVQGPIGPSDAYETSAPGASDVTSAAKTLTLSVPAGSYSVTGKAQEQNRDTTNSAALHCTLSTDAGPLDDMFSTALPWSSGTYGFGDAANVVHGSFTAAAASTITFSCSRSNGSSMFVNNPTLTAIKVGALH
jgi:hypothetical protein